jgi:hypothetical protein
MMWLKKCPYGVAVSSIHPSILGYMIELVLEMFLQEKCVYHRWPLMSGAQIDAPTAGGFCLELVSTLCNRDHSSTLVHWKLHTISSTTPYLLKAP